MKCYECTRHRLEFQLETAYELIFAEIAIQRHPGSEIYDFDGRQDKTATIFECGKYYRTETIEEYVSQIKEPGSMHVSDVSTAKGTERDITRFLLFEEISQDQIRAIGCDGTNFNTRRYGRIMKLLGKGYKYHFSG
ncbi:hypothetical protein HHI36_017080 [Cryptolaemus montrouzieri]|uniref:Uncharacterized protein n=1 Tax=Cryptolaemus montrouzieri TaxID=559131 RepID=A0ABD2NLL7_9CUCU